MAAQYQPSVNRPSVNRPNVLVLGAGELGTAVINALADHLERGNISVLLRSDSFTGQGTAKQTRLSSLAALGVGAIQGDVVIDSEETLAKIFDPFHTIIGCTGMKYEPGIQLKIGRAVLAAKTPRYFPWQFGVDYDLIGRSSSQNLFTEQLGVRDMLRQQNTTDWVIISTGMFTSFLFEPAFGVVNGDKTLIRALGGHENMVTVTDPQDIGRVVAEIVYAAKSISGVVYTAGETLSYGQLRSVLEDQLQRDVALEECTVEKLKQELSLDPENDMKKYRVVFAEGRGVAWPEAETFNRQNGMRLQGVTDWILRHLVSRLRVN